MMGSDFMELSLKSLEDYFNLFWHYRSVWIRCYDLQII